jgi:hypothetical protein
LFYVGITVTRFKPILKGFRGWFGEVGKRKVARPGRGAPRGVWTGVSGFDHQDVRFCRVIGDVDEASFEEIGDFVGIPDAGDRIALIKKELKLVHDL